MEKVKLTESEKSLLDNIENKYGQIQTIELQNFLDRDWLLVYYKDGNNYTGCGHVSVELHHGEFYHLDWFETYDREQLDY